MNDQTRIKEIVREVLKEDERSRDNDTWLILNVLRKMGFKIYIDYHDFRDIPSFESITRCRRKIQNEEKEFLASPEVEEQRNRKREECRDMYKNTQFSFQ